MEAAAEKIRSATLFDLQAWTYYISSYTRLPAGGTYYPICMFPTNSERIIGISDAFSAFCVRVSVILPTCSLYPQQKRAYSALQSFLLSCCFTSTEARWPVRDGQATLAGMDLYIQVHARRLLPSAVPWIYEDRLLPGLSQSPFLRSGTMIDDPFFWKDAPVKNGIAQFN